MNIFLQKQARSFRNAFRGIVVAIQQETHCKIHLLATIAVIVLGILLHIALNEWIVIFICIAMVWCLELINTAIENIVDMVSPKRQERARNIKDIAAGAVLFAAICSVIIACLIFIPKIISW
ncbi:MAG: diacylglycerol kinase family protein [Paludibacteraceae bacterium]|nr:diacylglycerol kinase family protein [Paludibacteraceae bacterium]MBP8781450.1 diacylglycerol kinase family protein [Paludibacteraceae bacterium]